MLAVSGHDALDVEPDALLAAVRNLSDDDVVALFEDSAAVIGCAERLQLVAAAVITERSAAPHGGLAGKRGHRSPVTMIQDITGGSRVDATRTVRVGSSLLDDVVAADAVVPVPVARRRGCRRWWCRRGMRGSGRRRSTAR